VAGRRAQQRPSAKRGARRRSKTKAAFPNLPNANESAMTRHPVARRRQPAPLQQTGQHEHRMGQVVVEPDHRLRARVLLLLRARNCGALQGHDSLPRWFRPSAEAAPPLLAAHHESPAGSDVRCAPQERVLRLDGRRVRSLDSTRRRPSGRRRSLGSSISSSKLATRG
jgi:hypothetical protein